MDKLNNWEAYAKSYANEFIHYLPNLISAILILVIGWWFIKILSKIYSQNF